MTLQGFKSLLEAQPFEPFRIVMSSGESYEVRHPEMAKLMRTKLMIFLDPDKEGIADRFRMCSLLHVTTVELAPGAGKPVDAKHKPELKAKDKGLRTKDKGPILMKLKPLQDRVIVKQSEAEAKTKSGILLPDAAKEKPTRGKVVAVGPGKLDDKGKPMEIGLSRRRRHLLRQIFRHRRRGQRREVRHPPRVGCPGRSGVGGSVSFVLCYWSFAADTRWTIPAKDKGPMTKD